MSEPFHLSQFLPYRLAVLAERLSRRLAEAYEKMHGLSMPEWRVMVHLQRGGPLSVRDIHHCVNLEKPRVSRAVSRLEERGFVAKRAGKGDGRLVEINLTEAGEAVLADIIPVAREIEARLLSGIPEDQIATFLSMMEAIHDRLDADPHARARHDLDPVSD